VNALAPPSSRDSRHRRVGRLGAVGAALGVVAGGVQATLGARIPSWTGDKLAPVPLGALTVALSLLAAAAAVRQTRPATPIGVRAVCALALVVPGLLCFSTVGRLWYLPGPMLLLAAAVSLDSPRDTATLVASNWLRCLLGLLGGAEALMAVSATPLLLAVGAAGGLALVVAAGLGPTRKQFLLFMLAGTVPFAALAWTAVVPVALALLATAIASALTRQPPRPTAPTGRMGFDHAP
jgi:hypothetical protein